MIINCGEPVVQQPIQIANYTTIRPCEQITHPAFSLLTSCSNICILSILGRKSAEEHTRTAPGKLYHRIPDEHLRALHATGKNPAVLAPSLARFLSAFFRWTSPWTRRFRCFRCFGCCGARPRDGSADPDSQRLPNPLGEDFRLQAAPRRGHAQQTKVFGDGVPSILRRVPARYSDEETRRSRARSPAEMRPGTGGGPGARVSIFVLFEMMCHMPTSVCFDADVS